MRDRSPQEPRSHRGQMIQQFGTNTITDETVRLACKQALGCILEGELDEGESLVLAEHVAEAIAKAYSRGSRCLDRVPDESRAAEFEKSAMTDVVVGGPAKQ